MGRPALAIWVGLQWDLGYWSKTGAKVQPVTQLNMIVSLITTVGALGEFSILLVGHTWPFFVGDRSQ